MPDEPRRKRIQLELTQLLGGSLAAVTATVAASYFGVAGTLLGAAMGSIVGTVGTTVYAHYLERTHRQVRSVVLRSAPVRRRPVAGAAAGSGGTATGEPADAMTRARPAADADESTLAWLRARRGPLAMSAGAAFLVVIVGLTAFELLADTSLSRLLRGDKGGRPSVAVVVDDQPKPRRTRPAAPSTPTSTATPTPTMTVYVPPEETATPTASTPSIEPTPTSTLAPSPTGSPTGQ